MGHYKCNSELSPYTLCMNPVIRVQISVGPNIFAPFKIIIIILYDYKNYPLSQIWTSDLWISDKWPLQSTTLPTELSKATWSGVLQCQLVMRLGADNYIWFVTYIKLQAKTHHQHARGTRIDTRRLQLTFSFFFITSWCKKNYSNFPCCYTR